MFLTDAESVSDLKRIYKRLAKTAHPDGGGSDEEFIVLKGQFERLLEAYEEDNPVSIIKALLSESARMNDESTAVQVAKRAQELMAQHNMSMSQVEAEFSFLDSHKIGESRINKKKEDRPFELALASVIAENMQCKVIKQTTVKNKVSIVFVGREYDRELAIETYRSLLLLLLRKLKDRYGSDYDKSVYREDLAYSYSMGFVMGIRGELGKQSRALKLATPDDVIKWYKKKYPNIGQASRRLMSGEFESQLAFSDGSSDGKSAVQRKHLS